MRSRNNRRRCAHPTKSRICYASMIACCPFLLSRAAAFAPSSGCISRAPPANGILSRSYCAETTAANYHPIVTRQKLAAPGVPPRSTRLYNLFPKDDDDDDLAGYEPAVAAQIRKARLLLEDAKKKQQSQEEAAANGGGEETAEEKLPFFAAKSFTATAAESARKIKSKTQTGEIIADGDAMASQSKSEPWENRSLDDMFAQEARMDFDGNLVEGEGNSLAERDVGASIYNLRKKLQNEDFRRVFDSRNRFIGEVD